MITVEHLDYEQIKMLKAFKSRLESHNATTIL